MKKVDPKVPSHLIRAPQPSQRRPTIEKPVEIKLSPPVPKVGLSFINVTELKMRSFIRPPIIKPEQPNIAPRMYIDAAGLKIADKPTTFLGLKKITPQKITTQEVDHRKPLPTAGPEPIIDIKKESIKKESIKKVTVEPKPLRPSGIRDLMDVKRTSEREGDKRIDTGLTLAVKRIAGKSVDEKFDSNLMGTGRTPMLVQDKEGRPSSQRSGKGRSLPTQHQDMEKISQKQPLDYEKMSMQPHDKKKGLPTQLRNEEIILTRQIRPLESSLSRLHQDQQRSSSNQRQDRGKGLPGQGKDRGKGSSWQRQDRGRGLSEQRQDRGRGSSGQRHDRERGSSGQRQDRERDFLPPQGLYDTSRRSSKLRQSKKKTGDSLEEQFDERTKQYIVQQIKDMLNMLTYAKRNSEMEEIRQQRRKRKSIFVLWKNYFDIRNLESIAEEPVEYKKIIRDSLLQEVDVELVKTGVYRKLARLFGEKNEQSPYEAALWNYLNEKVNMINDEKERLTDKHLENTIQILEEKVKKSQTPEDVLVEEERRQKAMAEYMARLNPPSKKYAEKRQSTKETTIEEILEMRGEWNTFFEILLYNIMNN